MVDVGLAHRQIAGVSQSEIERELAQRLGRRLYELRTARDMTQEAVAIAAGISRNHYQLLEAGIGNRKTNRPLNPRLSTLVALGRVLNVPTSELIAEFTSETD